MAIDSGAFNQWTYKPFADAVDVFDNVTAALGCFDWADPVACLLTKDTAALLNVSDAYYGNATAQGLPHKEAGNATQVMAPHSAPSGAGVVQYMRRCAPLSSVPPRGGTQWGPVVDGVLLPAAPIELLAQGHVAPVQAVLLGTNGDEGSTFLTDEVDTLAALQAWCAKMFGPEAGAKVAAFYAKEDPPDPVGRGRVVASRYCSTALCQIH